MAADTLLDEEEQYDSSQDSDFAPDAAADPASDHSDSDDAPQPTKKRSREVDVEAEDAGYNNSGDEAIIERGKKRHQKSKRAAADANDDEGGEGGLIKTRRQRAAEKEERKHAAISGPVTVDVDAIWAKMLAGKPATSQPAPDTEMQDSAPTPNDAQANGAVSGEAPAADPGPNTEDSAMIRIKRTYNFAGRVHTEEKLVARDSAEAKLFLASQGQPDPSGNLDALPTKRATKKAFRSAFEPITEALPQRADLNLGVSARLRAGREAAALEAKKLNTVEKSRMDWAGYVDKEGIKDELEMAGRSKESYASRQDFLARAEARREDEMRRLRMAGRA